MLVVNPACKWRHVHVCGHPYNGLWESTGFVRGTHSYHACPTNLRWPLFASPPWAACLSVGFFVKQALPHSSSKGKHASSRVWLHLFVSSLRANPAFEWRHVHLSRHPYKVLRSCWYDIVNNNISNTSNSHNNLNDDDCTTPSMQMVHIIIRMITMIIMIVIMKALAITITISTLIIMIISFMDSACAGLPAGQNGLRAQPGWDRPATAEGCIQLRT